MDKIDSENGMGKATADSDLLPDEGEKLLALALEATSDGVWAWDVPTGKAYFSPRYFTMLGYEPDEMPASYETWASLLHPQDREKTQKVIQGHIENKSESYQVEFRLRSKSGGWHWILGRGKMIAWDKEGRPVRIVGSHVNIDSRKRAEQILTDYQTRLENMVKERTLELERTSSLLEATLDAIPDIIGIQDNQHRIIRYNAAGYRFLNMTHEEVVGKRCFELIGRSTECKGCATSECYRTKKPASVERYEESLDVWLDVRAYPILDNNGNLVQVIEHLRDITAEKKAAAENRKLHEQLQYIQKMESLGTLAGGIAHDFNNLLMGIQGRSSLMAVDIDPSHTHSEHLRAIEDYIRSATDLTKQLLGFARGGKYEVAPIEINGLVVDSAAMFGRTKKEIRIHTKLHDSDLVVEADRRQLEQVLLNMYINAWQAMPDGGDLYLKTKIVTLDDIFYVSHQAEPGNYVQISVTDTGIGMNDMIRKQIFDPFFTTKQKSRGTGLGLASAYGIIKNHGGMVTVYSEEGHGATFRVYLPLSEKKALTDFPAEEELKQGSETILLVDDEDMVVEVGQAMLEKLGYRVLIARGGEEAIQTVHAMGNQIDLVILDLIMPGMNGSKAFEHIREIRPDMRVMLSSGYAINGQAENIMQKGCKGFIQKPFSIYELSDKVRSILDQIG